ncbi:hypothetical protein HRR83_000272 [Exophiala dermatitidis]|uniref:Uncharacterized protein n=2 Tax=Exophiala dermatitidis TaxID=5970 RepID=H6C8T7_EXODN|nr:uncharacterized protein HMPREF1120_08470 [Exophiala dermatitidis NIH/UT8656]KAJ4523625.1 hypothetical protein HRR73_002808 [Exophiala dermatitidis]EHY60514.1 hypothetical protein HMPREF1120_08470 [Exophiala dermatitidis NIH/UT8656]KAJ4524652.1 hypothetical protein HRR75_000242 [Exophiala dermatitidis]KAJ4527520.1 hypothetical protein HRR74_000274 [Exophiala dermatitidis]KAJ4531093.1 hypothetical protein HRR76_008770 [Exophiala dermatitidis]
MASMDQQFDRSGFSLFPMPPTPPNRPRARAVRQDHQRTAGEDLNSARSHQRHSDGPSLKPAPLRFRKKRPTSIQPPVPTTSKYVPENDYASVAPSSPTIPWPQLVLDEHEEQWPLQPPSCSLAPSQRTSSCRSSQFLGPEGELDRKKLSVYLSGVLDTSFRVDVDSVDDTPLPLDHAERVSYASNDWRASYQSDPFSTANIADCQCPPGVVICRCCSSPEFEHFRRGHGGHKPKPSISSTTCFLAVPRARFRSTLVDVEEVDTPSSPPPLMYDSEDSEELDWSLPNSPTFEDRRQHYQQTPTPAPRPREPHTARPPVPSFSLPFSRGRQIRPKFHDDRNSMPWEQPSPSSTIPTLASISTVSTFTFDFGDEDDQTEYDPFDDHSDVSEIRTWEPIQKAKPVLVHCKGPSPISIKYGHDYHYKTRDAGYYSSTDTFGYATLSVS